MSQLLNKAKGYLYENKEYFIIGAVLLVAGIIGWNMWSNSNVSTDGITTNTVREQYKSVGTELKGAGQAVTESQRLTTEIRQTNTTIIREINTSREINKSDSELIESSKRILREARESGKVEN